MAVHRTLRFEFNLWLVVGWALTLFALLLYTRGMVVRLAGAGMLLGGVGGFLQHLALAEGKKALLAATSAREVRAALQATPAGARYLQFFWAAQLLALVLVGLELGLGPALPRTGTAGWAVLRAGLDFVAVSLSFALARELVSLPAIWRLERSAK
jgi:hypothetical protein